MRIRQIVFAAHDLHQSQDVLATLLHLMGPFRDPGVAEFGIDNAVFCFGDQFIEVMSPTQPDTACSRHLDRHLQVVIPVHALGAGPVGVGKLLPGPVQHLLRLRNHRRVLMGRC